MTVEHYLRPILSFLYLDEVVHVRLVSRECNALIKSMQHHNRLFLKMHHIVRDYLLSSITIGCSMEDYIKYSRIENPQENAIITFYRSLVEKRCLNIIDSVQEGIPHSLSTLHLLNAIYFSNEMAEMMTVIGKRVQTLHITFDEYMPSGFYNCYEDIMPHFPNLKHIYIEYGTRRACILLFNLLSVVKDMHIEISLVQCVINQRMSQVLKACKATVSCIRCTNTLI